MQTFINLANDLVIIVGNIIIFSIMLNFKDLSKLKKIILLGCCLVFLAAYTLCAYVFGMPYIHATILCFTIPSLITFWIFSNVRDSRFFLTFCIVDTGSLIIAFITKLFAFTFETVAPYVTFVVNIVLYTLIIVFGYKFFKEYAKLMRFKQAGWLSMMIASFVIYFAFYFIAAYPFPIKDRLEYVPVYIVFCLVVISCYAVFWDSIVKTKKIHDQYTELEKGKIYHQIAYTDSLTGLLNRVSYIEKINELERNSDKYENISCVVIDVNDFKNINDKFGHHAGDLVLQFLAKNISEIFSEANASVYRIGGDEFCILITNTDENIIRKKLAEINPKIAKNKYMQGNILSVAFGYSSIITNTNQPRITIEQSFNKADKNMYENKRLYKMKTE